MDFTAGGKIARRKRRAEYWLYKWRQIVVKNFAESVRYSCARWEPRGGEGGGRGLIVPEEQFINFPEILCFFPRR